MNPTKIEKKGTNRRGFVKNIAAGAGGFAALSAFQSEQDKKKKSKGGGDLTKIEELETKIKTLEDRLRTLEDIEAIKKLQRAYGYYLEHWMAEDIIDCFADGPDAELLVAAGRYRGKDNIRDFFHHGRKGVEWRKEANNDFLHQVMQLSGIVHVAPDGKTAQGRWYGFGANAFPAASNKVNPGWMDGVYEMDYIKQDDRWRIKRAHWCMTFHAPWGMSFVPEERRMDQRIDHPYQNRGALEPVGAPEDTLWPSGFVCPFHFDNPATGRKRLT